MDTDKDASNGGFCHSGIGHWRVCGWLRAERHFSCGGKRRMNGQKNLQTEKWEYEFISLVFIRPQPCLGVYAGQPADKAVALSIHSPFSRREKLTTDDTDDTDDTDKKISASGKLCTR